MTALPSLKLTAKAPENGWLEDYFPIGVPAYFQGRAVGFREGIPLNVSNFESYANLDHLGGN